MPKYIIAGGQFNPFTYDELVKPVQQAAQAHLTTQEALADYEAKAGTIGSLIGNGEENELARRMYDDYMMSVKDAAANLYANGYNRDAAKALMDAKARFGTDIGKISQAIESREKRAAEYRQMSAKDRLLAEYNPADKGLDNWIANPQFGDFKHYSGDTLIQDGKQIGANIAKQLREDGTWASILGSQYWEKKKRVGASADELNEAYDIFVNGGESTNPFVNLLADAARSIYQSSGISDWADRDTENQAKSFIMEGLHDAIGTQADERLENKNFIDAKTWLTYDLQNRELAEKKREFDVLHPAISNNATVFGDDSVDADGNVFYAGTTPRRVITEGYRKMARTIKNDFEKYYGQGSQGVVIKGWDGRGQAFDNIADATRYVYQYDLREKYAKDLFGIDIARDPTSLLGVILDKNKQYGQYKDGTRVRMDRSGGHWHFMVERAPGTNEWGEDKARSALYEKGRKEYEDNLEELRKLNKGVKLDKIALDPDSESKLREKFDIDQSISLYDLEDAIASKEFNGYFSAVDVASAGPNGLAPRTQAAANLSDMIMKNGGIDSSLGIYKVKKGRIDKNSPVKKMDDFIPENSKIDENTIHSINVDLDSIINGGYYVTTDKGEFFMNGILLGTPYFNLINYLRDDAINAQGAIDLQNSWADKMELRKKFTLKLRELIKPLDDSAVRIPHYQGIGNTSSKGQVNYAPVSSDVNAWELSQ